MRTTLPTGTAPAARPRARDEGLAQGPRHPEPQQRGPPLEAAGSRIKINPRTVDLIGVFGSTAPEDFTASAGAVTFLVERFGMSDFRTFLSDFERSFDVHGDSQVPGRLRRHVDLSVRDLNHGTAELMGQIRSL